MIALFLPRGKAPCRLDDASHDLIASILERLDNSIEKYGLLEGLKQFYGASKQLLKHSLAEMRDADPGARRTNVLKYLFEEIVELSNSETRSHGRKVIRSRDVLTAMAGDTDLKRLLS